MPTLSANTKALLHAISTCPNCPLLYKINSNRPRNERVCHAHLTGLQDCSERVWEAVRALLQSMTTPPSPPPPPPPPPAPTPPHEHHHHHYYNHGGDGQVLRIIGDESKLDVVMRPPAVSEDKSVSNSSSSKTGSSTCLSCGTSTASSSNGTSKVPSVVSGHRPDHLK